MSRRAHTRAMPAASEQVAPQRGRTHADRLGIAPSGAAPPQPQHVPTHALLVEDQCPACHRRLLQRSGPQPAVVRVAQRLMHAHCYRGPA